MHDAIILTGSFCSIVILAVFWKITKQLDKVVMMFEILNKRVHDLNEVASWQGKNLAHFEGSINKLCAVFSKGDNSDSWKG
ncbi:MAG: hypothetical protein HY746_06245 [Elusimicrobia bacterium]|nr:hypothetical protein [Elusimicrobiota bacterium]